MCLLKSVCLSMNLKLLTFGDSTRSAGSEFKIGTMRLKEKNFCVLVFASGTISLRGWPRRFVFRLGEKKSLGFMQLLPFRMLKQNTRSEINHLCSKISSLRSI